MDKHKRMARSLVRSTLRANPTWMLKCKCIPKVVEWLDEHPLDVATGAGLHFHCEVHGHLWIRIEPDPCMTKEEKEGSDE